MKKLALITGASSGLGMQITKELANLGYHTIGSARREELLKELASSVNGSYKTFSGTNAKSVLDLANYTKGKYESQGFEKLLVVAAADMHEDVTKTEKGVKRYTTQKDFDEDYIERSKTLSVISPMLLYAGLIKEVPNMDFVYISSQAAKQEFWNKGNSIYGRNKRLAEENFMKLKNSYSLRFGFIDTEMADKMLSQLEGIEPFVHKDENLANPLKDKKELFLPVSLVAKDVARFTSNKENFGLVEENVYEYKVAPSKELYETN